MNMSKNTTGTPKISGRRPGNRLLQLGALLLLVGATIVPYGVAEGPEAPDSPLCGDFKGENAGTGGDKYTQCNAHPDNGRLVNFVCANPSANAIEVTANDPDAEAKGKLNCDGTLVARCNLNVACAGADTWDNGGDIGTKHDGDCLGGTDEWFDSGMAWACASVGGPLCDGAECDPGDLINQAEEAANDAIETVNNITEGPQILEALATLFDDSRPTLRSLAVGLVDYAGNAVGVVCTSGLCEWGSIECVEEQDDEDTRWCSVANPPVAEPQFL